MIIYVLIYLIIIGAAVLAVISKKLINSAIMLAVLSIGVSLLFFSYEAPWAGVFELSVCAGLITVIFISAVSLVKQDDEEFKEDRTKYKIFPLILMAFIIISSIFVPDYFMKLSGFAVYVNNSNESIGKFIWLYRGIDIIGQITILSASVFVIKHIFFRKSDALEEK
jgi:NADH-quinone oxidoreductase subunit J